MIDVKQVLLALLCVSGISTGQILFKMAAIEWRAQGTWLNPRVVSLMSSAMGLYALMTVLWIWLLQRLPLSRAYPFMALSFVIVPVAGWWLLGERLRTFDILGMLAICGGVILLASSRAA